MKLKLWVAGLALVALVGSVSAQDQKQPQMSAEEKAAMEAWMKASTPGDAHKALNSMVGTWDTKVSAWMAPGQPPMVTTGTSENKWVLGGRWVQQTFSGTFMGMPFSGIGYTGYDNIKKQYVGSWMDTSSTSMMTSMSTGSSADGKTWTFSSSMDDPSTGKPMPVTEKVTMVDNDHHNLEMWTPGPDGKMYKMMEINYTRKK